MQTCGWQDWTRLAFEAVDYASIVKLARSLNIKITQTRLGENAWQNSQQCKQTLYGYLGHGIQFYGFKRISIW